MFVFTDDQKKAATLIENFLSYSNKEKMFLLCGYAGTGKTTLINYILKKHHDVGKSIAVSSFTNKATNVISSVTPFATGISLYRLLGLKSDEDSQQLVFGFKGKDKLKEFDIIVVDEISMLSDDCFLLLKEKVEKKRYLKIILMGDPAQLPPVQHFNEEIENYAELLNRDSLAFDEKNYTPNTCYELKEVIRQNKNSDIYKLSFYIRNIIDKINEDNKKQSDKTDDSVAEPLLPPCKNGSSIPIAIKLPLEYDTDYDNITNSSRNTSNNLRCNNNLPSNKKDLIFLNDTFIFTNYILEYFDSEEYKKDSSYAKVLAYRNVVIDNLNKKIRNKIFFSKTAKPLCDISPDLSTLMVGENLILNAPAYDLNTEEQGSCYHTSDELIIDTILDYSFLKQTVADLEFNFPYFLVRTKRKNDGKVATLKIINPAYKIRFAECLSLCGKKIAENPDSKKIFKNVFYPFKKEFAYVNYSYAVTIHRIQGSTIENVFYVQDDVENITKASTKALWQANYVAITRASKRLFILNRNDNRILYKDIFPECATI